MGEEKIHENALLSFKSFLKFMFLAGLILSLTEVIFNLFLFILNFQTRMPGLSLKTFFEPFLLIVIKLVDAVISGILFYPIYKLIVRKVEYFRIIKLVGLAEKRSPTTNAGGTGTK